MVRAPTLHSSNGGSAAATGDGRHSSGATAHIRTDGDLELGAPRAAAGGAHMPAKRGQPHETLPFFCSSSCDKESKGITKQDESSHHAQDHFVSDFPSLKRNIELIGTNQ